MTAPEFHPDIESTLADAFTRRHAGQRPTLPSLVDVRRRAHRQSARRATVRAGAVVAAGVSAVAGGWAATRGTSSPSAVPAAPVTDGSVPDSPQNSSRIATLSVDGLWSAVAAQLGTTLHELRRLNPMIDFTAAPVPGTQIVVAGDEPDASLPQGWTSYQLVAGDYLYGIAQRFCTTSEEIVAANGWVDSVNHPLYSGDLIAVPADAC